MVKVCAHAIDRDPASYRYGFDAGALAVLEEAEKLVEALSILANPECGCGIKTGHCKCFSEETRALRDFASDALQAYREKFGGSEGVSK